MILGGCRGCAVSAGVALCLSDGKPGKMERQGPGPGGRFSLIHHLPLQQLQQFSNTPANHP